MLQIASIEVIRSNPGVAVGVPVNKVGVPAGEKVELTYGDKLRVNVSLEYRGRGQTVTLYGAVGVRGIGFLEKLDNEADMELPDSPADFSPCTGSVDIPITSDIDPGTNYDIYCKILEYAEAGLPEVDDVIDIVGIPPTYELLEETIYPYAYVYDGDVEVSAFTFKTDPFTPANWITGLLASYIEDEVRKAGGRVMEMRVYVDKTPLLWSDWRIEVVGIPPKTEGVAMSLGITWWAVAILAALAIALIIVITWSIKTIVSSFTHKPLSEEIKATWSRETLISIIGDFEVKLERPPTPSEELEAMSDEELRDYCNQMAEEIVPPEISWLPLAIVGGLGVLGVGLAAALAARPRE